MQINQNHPQKSSHERRGDRGRRRARLLAPLGVLILTAAAAPAIPSAVADTCVVDPPTAHELAEMLRNAITSRNNHTPCLEDIQDCQKRLLVEVDMCSLLVWLEAHATEGGPAHEAYEYQFPGCYPPGCWLEVSVDAAQVNPDDPTAPLYKGPRSPTCYRDDVCLVAEYGQGFLYGWNGTSILECTPGTLTTSFLLPPVCVRNGASMGPFGTGYHFPTIRALNVPFGTCVLHSFDQTVSPMLIIGPKGETYSLEPKTKTSPPRLVCNSIRSTSASSGE